MAQSFEIGNVVKLKSNSMEMTVSYVGATTITCCYFNHDTKKIEHTVEMSSKCFTLVSKLNLIAFQQMELLCLHFHMSFDWQF